MSEEMEEKICLVTGATQGIGAETALGLARKGAHVVIVGRDEQRCRQTAAWIARQTGNAQVDYLVADLSSLAEVRRLANAFKSKHARLDVLVNNAGAIFSQREITAEGYERTWALNHLSPFLLTELLLDRLLASAPARIVNVSSNAHESGIIDFEDLQGERKFSGIEAYRQSKLANILFTYALARRLAGRGVTANCLHPGVVATGFGHNTTGFIRTLVRLGRPFLMTPEKGAATTVYLASSAEVADVSGKYFVKREAVASSQYTANIPRQEKLWRVSARQTAAWAEARRLADCGDAEMQARRMRTASAPWRIAIEPIGPYASYGPDLLLRAHRRIEGRSIAEATGEPLWRFWL